MRTAIRIFTIYGMIVGFIYIYPFVFGIITLVQIRKKKPRAWVGICTVLFVNTIAGVLILVSRKKDYVKKPKKHKKNDALPEEGRDTECLSPAPREPGENMLSPEWFADMYGSVRWTDFDAETSEKYARFGELYGPGALASLDGVELLERMFYGKCRDNLCRALSCDSEYRCFGSTGGFFPASYMLYYNRYGETWMTTYGTGMPRAVSDGEAVCMGTKIRDAIVRGAAVISEEKERGLSSGEDFVRLRERLEGEIPGYTEKTWVTKYYHMIFPGLFGTYYSAAWQEYFLESMGVTPSDGGQFVRAGQTGILAGEMHMSPVALCGIFYVECHVPFGVKCLPAP